MTRARRAGCWRVAQVLDGASRETAAKSCGIMDRRTLGDWVLRYNAGGIAGLSGRAAGRGRKPLLQPEHEAALCALVEQGPSLAEHGVVRWRRADLVAVIGRRFGVAVDVRTMGRALRRPGFARISARPRHPNADAEA